MGMGSDERFNNNKSPMGVGDGMTDIHAIRETFGLRRMGHFKGRLGPNEGASWDGGWRSFQLPKSIEARAHRIAAEATEHEVDQMGDMSFEAVAALRDRIFPPTYHATLASLKRGDGRQFSEANYTALLWGRQGGDLTPLAPPR